MAGESHVQVVTKAVAKQKQHTLLRVQETGRGAAWSRSCEFQCFPVPVFSSSLAKPVCDSYILLLEGSRYPKLDLWTV